MKYIGHKICSISTGFHFYGYENMNKFYASAHSKQLFSLITNGYLSEDFPNKEEVKPPHNKFVSSKIIAKHLKKKIVKIINFLKQSRNN